ncbi:hypothetical protein OCU04_003103 [Sclerotinia nivalis]|uniref:Uncharacterized protein n=1 Tax=Sclerotinia nivalis TaxID=352851 RepID=A0A9X0AV05_9HELO|nr:hypothetical protein OCU04_003103 [Sclerotinia nivalis]
MILPVLTCFKRWRTFPTMSVGNIWLLKQWCVESSFMNRSFFLVMTTLGEWEGRRDELWMRRNRDVKEIWIQQLGKFKEYARFMKAFPWTNAYMKVFVTEG